jgi:hypothetical protein
MIADLRNAVLSESSTADVITAQIEMLDVSHEEEQRLRSSIERKILELLYPYMTDRYEDVLEAHLQTFDWIFSDPKEWQLPGAISEMTKGWRRDLLDQRQSRLWKVDVNEAHLR